jgi:hypothetical protein
MSHLPNAAVSPSVVRAWPVLLAVLTSLAATATAPDFTGQVAPLLAARCGACHGPNASESGYRIDHREQAVAGGDSGIPGIVPGKPAEFRRMVYQANPRAELDSFFSPFDCPDAGQAQPARIYDLHATILHLLGLDHTRLSFYNNGIERRLTDVHGHVIEQVLT